MAELQRCGPRYNNILVMTNRLWLSFNDVDLAPSAEETERQNYQPVPFSYLPDITFNDNKTHSPPAMYPVAGSIAGGTEVRISPTSLPEIIKSSWERDGGTVSSGGGGSSTMSSFKGLRCRFGNCTSLANSSCVLPALTFPAKCQKSNSTSCCVGHPKVTSPICILSQLCS